jgi:phage terminase large subunit-like protein
MGARSNFAYRARQPDRIIAEVNNGDNMIENTLRMVDHNVSYGRVWTSSDLNFPGNG